MTTESQPMKVAGKAILWQGINYGGEKIIFLLRIIVLANLLTPDDFGLLAIASVAIDMLMRISNFGMIPALVQREDASEADYDAAWTVGILRALAITLVIFITANMVANFFSEPRAANILRVLSLRPLIDASASIMVIRFTRKLDFRSLTILQIPKALSNTVVSIILAPWLGVWALVAGTLAGPSLYLIFSYILAPHRPRLCFQLRSIHSLSEFGRWVFWTSLVAMAGQVVLRLVISRQLGATELGLYYLAASLAFLPTDIASQIVGEVTFPFYSRLQKDFQQITIAFKAILTSLAVLLLPMSALLIALAPSLVHNVLGTRWSGTEKIIQILVIANIIDMLGETISPILKGVGSPDKVMIMESIQSLTMITLVWGLTDRYGVTGAAFAWIPSVALSQLVGLFILHKILPRPFLNTRLSIAVVTSISLLGGIIAYLLDTILTGILGLTVTVILVSTIMWGSLWQFERKYALGLSVGLRTAFPKLSIYLGFSNPEL